MMTSSAKKLVIALLASSGVTALLCVCVIYYVHLNGPIFGGTLLLGCFCSGLIIASVYFYLSWSVRSYFAAVCVSTISIVLIYASPRYVGDGLDGLADDLTHPLFWIASLLLSLVLCGTLALLFAAVGSVRKRGIPRQIDEIP